MKNQCWIFTHAIRQRLRHRADMRIRGGYQPQIGRMHRVYVVNGTALADKFTSCLGARQ